MITVLGIQQAGLAVRRADADQHPTGARQRRQHRCIDLGVGGGGNLVTPDGHLVEHARQDRLATDTAEAVGVDSQGDAVAQPYLTGRRRPYLALKNPALRQEAGAVAEHGARLVDASGQDENMAAFAGGKLVLLEQRQVIPQCSSHAGLAATTAHDAPELTNAPLRQATIASYGVEDGMGVRASARELCVMPISAHSRHRKF
jgi:hypothetical protein